MKKKLQLNKETMSILNMKEMSRVAGQIGGGCPAADSLDRMVLLPNAEDCSSFFMCNNGTPILRECPPGTTFNEYLGKCDLTDNSGCQLIGSRFVCATNRPGDCGRSRSCNGQIACIPLFSKRCH